MKTTIGIDLGTSGVKLLLIDDQRRLLAQSGLEYEVAHPREGWAEIDPEIWYDRTLEGLRRLLRGQDPACVEAIGVTGQMHTLVLLDGQGRSARPAMMWNDKRTAGCIPTLRKVLASEPDGAYLSGIVSTGSPAANLYWLSREEPESFRRVRRFLIGPDYIVYRLTGTAGTDYVEASTSSMYLIRRREWSRAMCDLIGLDPAFCPPVRGSGEIAGTLLPDVAASLGLRRDVKVIVGTGDNPATAVSTGCLGRGDPVLSLGTSGVLVFPVADMDSVSRGKVILCSLDGRRFTCLVQGTVQSTGESISWWTRRVLSERDYGTLDGKIDRDVIRRARVLFYPHINGDKTLYADPALRGAFIGLDSETGPEELYRAVLEGLCFAFRQLADGLGLDLRSRPALRVVGGGARSDLWLGMLADVLNVPVHRLGGNIGPAFGAALLAWGAGHPEVPVERLNEGCLEVERTFLPDPELTGLYDERYEKYLRIHDALKHISGGGSIG